MGRRPCVLARKPPDRNSHLPGLVGEVLDDPPIRKDDDSDGKRLKRRVIALEWRGVLVSSPLWFEGDLRNLTVVRPTGGYALCALRTRGTISGCFARTLSSVSQIR